MTFDRMVFGMHHLNISQTGKGYGQQQSLSHTLFELDLCGVDSGIDYWYNRMPNTTWKCAGRWGTRASGNTYFFWSCDEKGNAKKVFCADGKYRVLTMAMTHSDRNAEIGKLYTYGQILVSEGTQGFALGNHIHLEVCEGVCMRKVVNAKGYYNLPNMLDARKVFFVLDGFTTVVNTGGLEFKHCKSVPVIEEKEDDEMLYFIADLTSCRIRETLEFENGRPVGKILGTIPKGGKARITHFTQRHEKDGWEWFQVRYETPTGKVINGYVQGDLKSYKISR